MSIEALLFHWGAGKADAKRDAAIPLPQGITECRNISYGPYGDDSLLDVYYPDGTTEALPTIVSIHGGGYVYGNKEIYRRYGMDMARRGFALVNFNYRLAPKWKFPTPLADTNAVLEWVVQNHTRYHLDPQRIILVGDSAGAQLASHYAAIHTNSDFAAHFDLKLPKVRIVALGLNCGMYDAAAQAAGPRKGLALDYLGRKLPADDPRLRVLDAITDNYPPAFITTACHDFLRENAEPMWEHLTKKGIPCQWKCYGTEEDKTVGHVFHVNIVLPDAVTCNDDAAAFFRKYV
ncbi:MAG: alpha/beta hydrolase fold domain-containing protein [Oscillospiraceae bacterium]|nr:alpha/beta hydrolase fold domain-containing protein [Oscillospiraceae bacterium]